MELEMSEQSNKNLQAKSIETYEKLELADEENQRLRDEIEDVSIQNNRIAYELEIECKKSDELKLQNERLKEEIYELRDRIRD